MAKNSAVNLDITNNADGVDITGGTTRRKLAWTGADITIAGTGTATHTFPSTTSTLARTDAAQTFTGDQTFSGKINNVTITTPATGSTLTIADGKTATINSTLTLTGTDSTTMTFPTTSATLARTDAANTFTGIQTISTNLVLPAGAAATPGTYFSGDSNTGIWSAGADTIAFSTGGTEKMRMIAGGSLGIGIAAPLARLQVAGVQPADVATTPGTAADDLMISSGGIGGTTTIATTGVGGIGAAFTFTGGTGGVASSATTASTGGVGGEATITGGTGGAATAAGTTRTGGAGGAVTIKPGTGGAASAGTTNNAGAGGALNLYGGLGGTGTTANGAGGAIKFFTSIANAAAAERARFDGIDFMIGRTTSPGARFSVESADNEITTIFQINAVSASITAADYFTQYWNSTASIGSVSGTATAGLIAYNTFTGAHYVQLENELDVIETGKIVVANGKLLVSDGTEYLPEIKESETQKDKRVFGVFSGLVSKPCRGQAFHEEHNVERCSDVEGEEQRVCSFYQGSNDKALYQVLSLGTGQIWVTNTNGNIEVGDYICTSSVKGYGEKQDDDLLHNYTVAKATENVDWSEETESTKLIACTYHCA